MPKYRGQPMTLTAARATLLAGLDAIKGGCLPSESIKIGYRRMASQMQRDGLVQWRNVSGNRHSLKGQVLHITDKGRSALKQYRAEWQSVPATD